MSLAEKSQNRVHIIQGEFFVADDPGVMVTTILGSCVAACIRDPMAGVGGINHFLLPGSTERGKSAEAERMGVHLMELLVNGLLKAGARRERLEAKLFGGARTVRAHSDIGRHNVEFAERFLRDEGIAYVGGSTGGLQGRRIQYCPSPAVPARFCSPARPRSSGRQRCRQRPSTPTPASLSCSRSLSLRDGDSAMQKNEEDVGGAEAPRVPVPEVLTTFERRGAPALRQHW